MKIGKNLVSAFALFLLVAAGSIFVSAQTTGETKQDGAEKQERMEGRKHHRGGHGEGFAGRAGKRGHRGSMIRGLDRLQLSEPQQSQIKTIIETHKNGQMPFYEEMRGIKTRMRDGSATENDKVRMQELHQQRMASSEQLKTSILGVLTPDQLQQLETMKAERKQKMEERRQRFMQRKQQQKEQKPDAPVKTDNQ